MTHPVYESVHSYTLHCNVISSTGPILKDLANIASFWYKHSNRYTYVKTWLCMHRHCTWTIKVLKPLTWKKSNTTMHTVVETKSFFFHLIFHKCKTYVSANNWLRQASTVQATSILTKASVWYEIRVLWAMINYVKIHTMTLAFILQTDINQIFQTGYCASL